MSIMDKERVSLLDAVIGIARRAGDAVLEVYERDFGVESKADHSPLTEADRASHALIERELAGLTPRLPVWSEESAEVPLTERAGWSSFWLVDPLDGTKEFIKRNGEFTVNIALIEGHEPVLGVVGVPVSGRIYAGGRDLGACIVEPDGERRTIRVQRPAAEPFRVVGSRSHRGTSLERFLAALGPHEMVPMGSSLKLCLVAEGCADVYPRLGPTSEWDTAAAQAVVEGAGGLVVDLEGRPLRYNTKAEVLNPFFVVYGDPDVPWLERVDVS